MKILIFIVSIRNTISNSKDTDYKELIDNLERIGSLNNNDKVLISFCDDTENKNMMLFHARKMINYMKDKNIVFGNQLLGDVYYRDIVDGAVLYDNPNMDKVDKIIEYAKKVQKNNCDIELIIADGNMDVDGYTEKIKKSIACPCSFIYNVSNLREINETLDELFSVKQKRLQLEN